MTMELSMTIALVSALAIREVFTALVIVFFVLIAEVLEELTVGRGRRAIQDLLNLLPQQVELRRPDGVQSASLTELRMRVMWSWSGRAVEYPLTAWLWAATRSSIRPPLPASPCRSRRFRALMFMREP